MNIQCLHLFNPKCLSTRPINYEFVFSAISLFYWRLISSLPYFVSIGINLRKSPIPAGHWNWIAAHTRMNRASNVKRNRKVKCRRRKKDKKFAFIVKLLFCLWNSLWIRKVNWQNVKDFSLDAKTTRINRIWEIDKIQLKCIIYFINKPLLNWPVLMIWYFHRKSLLSSDLIHSNSRCIQNNISGIRSKTFVYNIPSLSPIKYLSPLDVSRFVFFFFFLDKKELKKSSPKFNDVKWNFDLLNFLEHWAPVMQKAVFISFFSYKWN